MCLEPQQGKAPGRFQETWEVLRIGVIKHQLGVTPSRLNLVKLELESSLHAILLMITLCHGFS